MISDEEKATLEANFERAKAKLTSIDGFVGSGPAQQAYTRAFQALVKAGLRMQLKGKYRGR